MKLHPVVREGERSRASGISDTSEHGQGALELHLKLTKGNIFNIIINIINNMPATTLNLSPNLQQRLRWASKRSKMSVSKYAENLLSEALKKSEQAQLERIYQAWNAVKGIGKEGITDLSQNVDEVLYGEQGAWRGSDPMTPETFKKLKHGK